MSAYGGVAQFTCCCLNSINWFFEPHYNISERGQLQLLNGKKTTTLLINSVQREDVGYYHCLCIRNKYKIIKRSKVVSKAAIKVNGELMP